MRRTLIAFAFLGASTASASLITPTRVEGWADDPWKAFSAFTHKIADPAAPSPGDFYSGAFSASRGYVRGDTSEGLPFEQEHAEFSPTGEKVWARNVPVTGNTPFVCLSPYDCSYVGSASTAIGTNKSAAHVLYDWPTLADFQNSASSSLWTEGFVYDVLPGFTSGSTTLSLNLDGSWEGMAGFLYELGVLYIDRGGYNPDFADYPAAAMVTGSFEPGMPRLFGVVGPGEDGAGEPPAPPPVEPGSSINRSLTFTFDWLPGERVLVYSLLSTGAGSLAGQARFENTAKITGFTVNGGFIASQLSDFDWSGVGQDVGPGTEVPEPSGVLLLGGGLLLLAGLRRKRA